MLRPKNQGLNQKIWWVYSGFTLIELLIVIAIIMILMAVLLPALRKARETSMKIACANNLRQVDMTFESYCGDYDGWLPLYQRGVACWVQYMYPQYFKPEEVYGGFLTVTADIPILNCPSHTRKFEHKWGILAIGRHTSYAMNYLGIGGMYAGGWCRAAAYRKHRDIRYPSRQLGFVDSQNGASFWRYDGNSESSTFFVGSYVWGNTKSFGFRHGRAVNIAFPDGHTEAMRRNDVPIPGNIFSATKESIVFWSNP